MFFINKYQEEKEFAIYKDKKDIKIRVQRLSENIVTKESLIDNLIFDNNTISLSTHNKCDFKINNKIIYRNTTYLIRDLQQVQETINLDTNLLFKPRLKIKYILNLIKGE